MAIALQTIVVRHERRIRAVFTVPLAVSAFTNLALYVISADEGEAPLVLQAYVVANSPNVVELAFDRDLSPWASYTLAALLIPGTDGSATDAVADANNSGAFALALVPTQIDVENPDDDLQGFIYGSDLLWGGGAVPDFVETDAGDLATVVGLDNYEQAITRRVASPVLLPWDQSYGDKAGDYVNGPTPASSTLAASAMRQAVADDRTQSASVAVAIDPTNPANVLLTLNLVPVSTPSGASGVSVPLGSG